MKITSELILDIADAEYRLQNYCEDTPIRPEPGPPASLIELADLESYLLKKKLPLPPSYREFLSVCNGVRNFKSYFSLLSTNEVMEHPHPSHERGYPSLSRFIIGRGDSLEFMAFDPDAISDKEMVVVSVSDDGEETRYPDFNQYLHARLSQLKRAIQLEEADRSDLGD